MKNEDNNKGCKMQKDISVREKRWMVEFEKTILLHIYDTQFNMNFLGEKMSMSRRQIQRKIKKITGLTPKEYIQELRFTEALRLLELKEVDSVKEVAVRIGFSSVDYFSLKFKERFKKLPSVILREH